MPISTIPKLNDWTDINHWKSQRFSGLYTLRRHGGSITERIVLAETVEAPRLHSHGKLPFPWIIIFTISIRFRYDFKDPSGYDFDTILLWFTIWIRFGYDFDTISLRFWYDFNTISIRLQPPPGLVLMCSLGFWYGLRTCSRAAFRAVLSRVAVLKSQPEPYQNRKREKP